MNLTYKVLVILNVLVTGWRSAHRWTSNPEAQLAARKPLFKSNPSTLSTVDLPPTQCLQDTAIRAMITLLNYLSAAPIVQSL